MIKRTLGCVLFLVLFSGMLFAQTQVLTGQIIKESVHWHGTIRIEGDVVVAPSGRLIVDPGTHILFSPGIDKSHSGTDKTRSELIVKGVLVAKGVINNKIWFTSASNNPRMQDWYGIEIINPGHTAIIEYAVIEYAYNGLVIKKSDPKIDNCQIQYNFNAGLCLELGAHPKIFGNIISENSYAGIICNTGSKPVFTDNMITKNDIGLINFGAAQPNLGNLKTGPNYNSGRNGLFDNLSFNIHNHSTKDIKAENDSWGAKDSETIAKSIHDGQDERKFGLVDFTPILGRKINLEEKIILSQTNTRTPSQASPQNALQQTSPPPTEPKKEVNTNVAISVPPTVHETVRPKQAAIESTLQNQPITRPAGKPIVDTTAFVKLAVNNKKPKLKPSKPSIDYNQVFLDAFLDGGRMILKKSRPIINDPNRGMNMHGKIIVRIIVSRMGNVESANVLRGLNAYFDGLAMDAARKFKFKPGTIKGNPVRFSTSLFFEF